jgi:hypothetical protein
MRCCIALVSISVLAGCGPQESAACSDAPLSGIEKACSRIEGRWSLQTAQRPRCGAELFDGPLIIERRGASLSGAAGSTPLRGTLYPEGVFELFANDAVTFLSVHGQHVASAEELRGGVRFGTEASEECDGEWQFLGTRQ